ncbi:MAG: efflux transporter outer membrane subunit [Henriciella sp.]|nr:efflux transporter outer membrane subunit [Henriciella sp.]
MKRTGVGFGLLTLAGCASVPSIAGDPVEFFPVAPDAPSAWAAAGVSGEVPTSDWLTQFGDPTLSELVSEALAANPSLRAQYFAVEASRAQARATYGRSLPSVSVSGSAGGSSTFVETAAGDDRVDTETFGVNGSLNWEVDLWGRVRAGIDAAEADLLVSEADLAAAQLSIAAQTATAWFDLNEALALERVAVQTYEARERALELTERRFSRGLSTALDVRTARTTLASAEAAIASRRLASGNAVRRLEILLGRYPEEEIDAPAEIATLDPLLSGGNPALLLSRRPDIASAEAALLAAGLRAEQARLALLPSLSISGTVSNNDTDFADTFDPSRWAASLIANLSAPLYNGGALRADRDAAIARAQISVETYASTVLSAWQEVENALAADGLLAQQEDAQARALEEAILAEDLATRQYTNGLVSIFNLIDSQTRRLDAESNLITARSARATNRINYHLALGGGLPVELPQPPILLGSTRSEEAALP